MTPPSPRPPPLSMSAELRRIPSLRLEAERLQAALEAETRERTVQRDQAVHRERLIGALQDEMELLATKVGRRPS